jgi:short-subunit dehydrogenase
VNGLAPIMKVFSTRRNGHIAIVASLAGYRGLPGAIAYGATKAALINMCEALKPDLERVGVKLSLINPGFVETPLTEKNDFPMPFLIPVEEAVAHIVRGLDMPRFETTFPRRFAFLMKALRVMPDRLFFALTRRMLLG